MHEKPISSSGVGTVALEVGNAPTDLYLTRLSPVTGQPSTATERLTKDGRLKYSESDPEAPVFSGGIPSGAYFIVWEENAFDLRLYFLDPESGKQSLVISGLPPSRRVAISPDGRQIAYSAPDGDSYSIRLGNAGTDAAESRVLCKACGKVQRFSPDGRYLLFQPEDMVTPDPNRKLTVRLLDLTAGKDRPWAEHPTDSVSVGGTLGLNSRWLWLALTPVGSPAPGQRYIVPWREEPVPQSEWVRIPLPDAIPNAWRVSPTGNFFYYFEGRKLMVVHFDPERAGFSKPQEVKFVQGSTVAITPADVWTVRGSGLVFSRRAPGTASVWVMKLPK
jgi:hypothetical protein